MIVGEQGLGFLTRNSGETWEKISITTSGSLFNVIGANDHYLIAGDFGEIFIVNTNTLKPEPLLPYRISPNWFSAVEVSSAGDFIVACGWGQILVSSPVAKHSRTTVFVPFN